MQDLAIHQISMMQGGPMGLVKFVAKAGLRKICLFTATPKYPDGTNMFPIVSASDKESFIVLMTEYQVGIVNAEYFPIMPGADVSQYEEALELAAALGAKRAVTHIHETDQARGEDQLGQLCELTRALHLEVGLEFTGFAGGCNNLDSAVHWHRRMDQANLKIAVDALHLFRTGGSLEKLREVDPDIIGYAQICDGPDLRVTDDYLDEAMQRMIPGEGIFPLAEFVEIFNDHVDLDIEVPGVADHEGPEDRAIRAIAAGRNLLEQLET